MLVAIDVGNTHIVIGVFEADDPEQLAGHWRVTTSTSRTPDEYAVAIRAMLRHDGIEPEEASGAIVASVVPPLRWTVGEFTQKVFNLEPMWIEPGIKTGMPVLYDNPREVGADRIVNAVAGHHYFGDSGHGLIIVDMGTATTFDCVSPRGEYLGGAIAPGIVIAMDALFNRASKLPRVDFARPPSPVGKTTVQSMQSGLFYGYAGLVDRTVAELRKELGFPVRVIATGGTARMVAPATESIERVEPDLTLHGLRILWERNTPR